MYFTDLLHQNVQNRMEWNYCVFSPSLRLYNKKYRNKFKMKDNSVPPHIHVLITLSLNV